MTLRESCLLILRHRLAHESLRWAIDSLLDTSFFAAHATTPLVDNDLSALKTLGQRWKSHLTSGKYRLSVPLDTRLGSETTLGGFWTTQYSFQDLPTVDPTLLEELQKSDLVIFKGDLKYASNLTFVMLG